VAAGDAARGGAPVGKIAANRVCARWSFYSVIRAVRSVGCASSPEGSLSIAAACGKLFRFPSPGPFSPQSAFSTEINPHDAPTTLALLFAPVFAAHQGEGKPLILRAIHILYISAGK
jgi:hypothetical protein